MDGDDNHYGLSKNEPNQHVTVNGNRSRSVTEFVSDTDRKISITAREGPVTFEQEEFERRVLYYYHH